MPEDCDLKMCWVVGHLQRERLKTPLRRADSACVRRRKGLVPIMFLLECFIQLIMLFGSDLRYPSVDLRDSPWELQGHFSCGAHFQTPNWSRSDCLSLLRMETSSVHWKHASPSPAPHRSRSQTPAVWCVKVDQLLRAGPAPQQELVGLSERSLPHAVFFGLQIAAPVGSPPRKMETSSWTEGWYVVNKLMRFIRKENWILSNWTAREIINMWPC